MIDIDNYVTPVTTFNDNYATLSQYLTQVIGGLDDFMDVSGELLTKLTEIFDYQISNYGVLGYHFVPIYLEDPIERVKTLMNYWKLLMVRDGQWTTILRSVDDKVELLGLTSGLVDTIEYGGRESVEDSKATEYGKEIGRAGNVNRNSMSENAPINAAINTINTPDNKSIVFGSSSDSETYSGTDTVTTSKSVDKSGSDTRTYDSPDRYQMYLDILKEHNVYSMVDKIIRTTIFEYNRVM